MHLDLNITPIEEWFPGKGKPRLISGPCSAENEKQLLSTATELAKTGNVHLIRAGIWKPRTRPGTFEGVGEKGLKWLQKVKSQTGLPVTTEVANVKHVELCLKYGIDILWIGARTSVNPFSVQEIADALRGTDIPVMVKNPMNPDLQLWIGALERINDAGITKLCAVHRGFSTFDRSPFKNTPMWEIPIELKTMCSSLPIFCDPSHIAGNRELIPMISQKAMDLDMDGLMIECHFSPQSALSDSKQQVTPSQLTKIIDELIIRESKITNKQFENQLEQLRTTIDEIDEEIIQGISLRMNIAERIGEYKKENKVTILQINRWEDIVNKRLSEGLALGLSENFVKGFLKLVHEESIRRQAEVMNIPSEETAVKFEKG
ncbi:bifunctional 3-deoxy-7-phosphoheptulonate synthase/chorismate mutase type II [bacterium BMS3Abin03]|jgi:chorismate mutase|nr:bifunctional 3-deoxy-7-phosphoheptulonate synthase/chorismate mutase type II [bacterium BMS3Abin03]MCG6959569.1 bifunctional 3-deoxy-7-phosphoheptulonate synthase/chorismate mutase type II [bacterium BMS3Abin03]